MTRHVPADEWRVAIHEAGHAIVAIERHIAVQWATIVPTDSMLGHVQHSHLGNEDDADVALLILAGAAAEEKATGRPHEWCAREFALARTLVRCELRDIKRRGSLCLHSDEERVQWHYAKAAALVAEHWTWITRTAKALIIYRTLYLPQIVYLRYSDSLPH